MNRALPTPVVALTAHARDVSAQERARFASRLQRLFGERALIFRTCHRVEVYALRRNDADELRLARLPAGGRVLTGEAAVRHAITVAVGSDSVVVGEDQVLHQLRSTLDTARAGGRLDPTLERLFTLALGAGRRARSWRHGPQASLADVAIRSVERQCGSVRARTVLVVGAGQMGRLAARAATRAGASVAVANRSIERAEKLAAATGARVEPFDPGQAVRGYAAVFVALAGAWTIKAETVSAIVESPAVVVDISVPGAVPARLADRIGARLITADDLARVGSDPASRNGRPARLQELIDRTTAEFLAWQHGRHGRSAAEALVTSADREREAELATLWRRLPNLEPDAREAIEHMTRHLAIRLLRQPLERLGRDADGRTERAIRDIFAL
jgi:glutamyl-tRNA reductase